MKTFSNFLVTFLAQWKIVGLTAILITTASFCMAQVPGLEAKHWYFGDGIYGMAFAGTPINTTINPTQLTNKANGVGYEGMVVVNDPTTGALLFYSNGDVVINRNHVQMTNGFGLIGHYSGAQSVLCLPIPGIPDQYYLLHHAAFDQGSGALYSTIVDFSNPAYPDGWVPLPTRNVMVSNANYSQANVLVSKPCTEDFWWIGHIMHTNQYHVILIGNSGFSPAASYTLAGTNTGDSYAMVHSTVANKIAISGLNLTGNGALGLILADFNCYTGWMGNATTIFPTKAGLGNFSPDGTKLYFWNDGGPTSSLHQYDLCTGVIVNMNTCCYAHDVAVAPNGKMYHIKTHYGPNPIAVINFPNLSAVGNACGYNPNGGVVGNFAGEQRRLPTFLAQPFCPTNDVDFPCMTILGSTFTFFQAQLENGTMGLDWTISQPCQGCTFEVQRGDHSGTFEAIGNLASNGKTNFQFTDSHPLETSHAYRIQLQYETGGEAYSETIWVGNGQERSVADLHIYPNPCSTTLNVHVGTQDKVNVNVFDLAGKAVLTTVLTEGFASLDLSSIAGGAYILKMTLNGKVVCKLFHKQK